MVQAGRIHLQAVVADPDGSAVIRESRDGTVGYYWIWGTFDKSQIGQGTDLEAIEQGFASVTPLTADRTNYETLERLRTRVNA